MKSDKKIFLSSRSCLAFTCRKFALVSATFLVLIACEDFTKIDPPKTSLVGETVFKNEATAEAAVVGIYSRMLNGYGFATGTNSVAFFTGLYSDELLNHSSFQAQVEFVENELSPSNVYLANFWSELYQYIYTVNSILEGLEKSSDITPAINAQLEGEVKFIRAFCYFYLVNMYGDVPFVETTHYKANSIVLRSDEAEVYDRIIEDLQSAITLLNEEIAGERIRPNRFVAKALLARVYLYLDDWVNAELEASSVIENIAYLLEDNLNAVFNLASKEVIWQLQPIPPNNNTFEWDAFSYFGSPFLNASMTNELVNSFEIEDQRRAAWIGNVISGTDTFNFSNKYKAASTDEPTEYFIVLRLAEQYLIRAEARAQQDNIIGAQEDLNMVRNRAGLMNTSADDKSSLLLAIDHERKVELFCEWGHRWFDLKRTEKADAILMPIKVAWQATDILFPIPQTEVLRNNNIEQNNGY